MSEQITWTHVDKLVRKMLDERGMLARAMNDAEVTYDLIKFLERSLHQSEICADSRGALMASLKRELDSTRQQLAEALTTKPSKTKKRLDALEKAVRDLQNKPDVSDKQCAASNSHNDCHRNALVGSMYCAEHQR